MGTLIVTFIGAFLGAGFAVFVANLLSPAALGVKLAKTVAEGTLDAVESRRERRDSKASESNGDEQ